MPSLSTALAVPAKHAKMAAIGEKLPQDRTPDEKERFRKYLADQARGGKIYLNPTP